MASIEQEAYTQPDLTVTLDRLWARFLPQVVERIAIVESAALATAAGTLSLMQRVEAISAAHKLAGILGTFGLNDGTELAREAEILFSREMKNASRSTARLQAIIARLRAIVENRRNAPRVGSQNLDSFVDCHPERREAAAVR